MLKARLYEFELRKRQKENENLESSKSDIGWGHQIRSYVLHPYRLVKDNRTNYESSNPDKVLNKLQNLKVIFSLGAGVDHIINLPSYNNTPIFRIKDPNMAERMSYHVHSQILIYQLKLNLFQKAQIKKKWLGEMETLLNNDITVGILGTGFLGSSVGKYLQK